MNRLLVLFLSIFLTGSCGAKGGFRFEESGETRPLGDVLSSSEIIIRGAVVGSGIGTCGSKEGVSSFYFVRILKVVKGKMGSGDIKACGSAPMLLASHYLIAGNKYSDDEIVFSPDAVLLAFPDGEYYRLISYDGPIVGSDRGAAYAVGLLEPDFEQVF